MRQFVKMIIILFLLAGAGGTAIAINNPKSALAVPFKPMAVAVLEVVSGALKTFIDTKTVTASTERYTITTAVQALQIAEGLLELTPVTVPTDDMTSFPSKQHPLYPEYLDSPNTQFKYVVDRKGTVRLGPSEVNTNLLLDEVLYRLEALKTAR